MSFRAFLGTREASWSAPGIDLHLTRIVAAVSG